MCGHQARMWRLHRILTRRVRRLWMFHTCDKKSRCETSAHPMEISGKMILAPNFGATKETVGRKIVWRSQATVVLGALVGRRTWNKLYPLSRNWGGGRPTSTPYTTRPTTKCPLGKVRPHLRWPCYPKGRCVLERRSRRVLKRARPLRPCLPNPHTN